MKIKRRFRKKHYRRPLAVKAMRLAKRVNRKVGSIEYKYLDNSLTATAFTNAGVIDQLTNVVEGLTNITRVAQKITIKRIMFRVNAFSNVAGTKFVCRVMLVQDRQTNGAIFATTDLLESVAAVDCTISQLNKNFFKRFKILYDKRKSLTTTGSNQVTFFNFQKRVNIPVLYSANAGTIADIRKNSLAIIFFTNVAANAPSFDYNSRLIFTDV